MSADLAETAQRIIDRAVAEGHAPGLVGLIDGADGCAVVTAGVMEPGTSRPVPHDAIVRVASLTKPIIAALVMTLIDESALRFDDPVERWLPELADRRVLRSPEADLDDVVSADRPILVEDLLTFRCGYGIPSDFSLPWVTELLEVSGGRPAPRLQKDADRWMADLGRLPLLSQPGERWLYNTGSDLQGVLISRVLGQPLGEILAERLLEPLSMADTGFHVPEGSTDRCMSVVEVTDDGYSVTESGAGQWIRPALFESGGSGLVSTVFDWAAFAAMLLAGGCAADGRRLLSERAVTRMTSDHTGAAERAAAATFLDGQGWGYGGSVDIAAIDAWNVPGRYGWMGGTGTAGYIVPGTSGVPPFVERGRTIALFGQAALTGPSTPDYVGEFLTLAVPDPPDGNR